MSKKTLALSHIDNYINGVKNTILLLENKFFYIFKVQIENVLNEEDRKEKLEDRLEIVFPRYNSDDFVLRYEILKKDKKRENIVVYLMDINYLNDCIIDDMKDYGFISIIPSFFISREKKDLNHYFNFDISETMLVITEYMNNNILDIQSFKLTKSSLDSEDFEVEDKFSIINTFNFVNIHFKKKIIIKDKNYLILATVKYEVGSSRDLESLYNGVLTRMWIKEDV